MTAVAIGATSTRRATTTHLRITARGRAVLLSLLALPLVATALIVGLGAGAANGSSSSTPLTKVTVVGGETLWGLAHEIAPNADPRDVIAGIMAVNQLKSADIQPGERLSIPAQYAGKSN
jgi:LysM repeat protein